MRAIELAPFFPEPVGQVSPFRKQAPDQIRSPVKTGGRMKPWGSPEQGRKGDQPPESPEISFERVSESSPYPSGSHDWIGRKY